ncbi:MAG: hypothetical protein LBH43_07615 [Treponema sp.]|nr:hypothetical protein [Treponema sp.]
MNRFFKFFFLMFIPIIFISCTTIVKFEIEHPPLVDMRNMESITVLPLEWKDNGRYDYLANDLTKVLISGVKKAKTYNFIEPAILRNTEKSDYWKYVDVYIDCKINNIDTHDKTEIKEEKEGEKTKTKKYVTRTATVIIEYKYITAIDEKVLGNFNKTAQASETFEESARSSKWWAELLLNIFIPQGPSSEKLSKSAVQRFSSMMNNELNPYTTTEEREIAESVNKEPIYKDAKKLVRQKKYIEALLLYKKIYEEAGSIVAGYNTALLLQANNQFTDALALLEELDDKLSRISINSPPFIKKEMERLKIIINEIGILEEYKN